MNIGVVPARLASKRLPKKILADLPAMFDKLGSSAGNQTDPIRQLVGSLEEASGKSDGFNIHDYPRKGYIKYKNDVSTLAMPMQRPTSTYASNTLELKPWF